MSFLHPPSFSISIFIAREKKREREIVINHKQSLAHSILYNSWFSSRFPLQKHRSQRKDEVWDELVPEEGGGGDPDRAVQQQATVQPHWCQEDRCDRRLIVDTSLFFLLFFAVRRLKLSQREKPFLVCCFTLMCSAFQLQIMLSSLYLRLNL